MKNTKIEKEADENPFLSSVFSETPDFYSLYDNYFLGLDDIEITSETLGNKEFKINLSYYFDRATKSLELEALSHIKEVSIYDMNGRLINLETPNTLKSNIDFNYIPKGLYIVKAKTDRGFESIKVLNQ